MKEQAGEEAEAAIEQELILRRSDELEARQKAAREGSSRKLT